MKLRMIWWFKKIRWVFLVTGMLLTVLGCSTPCQTIPMHNFPSVSRMGISGMVRVGDDVFLIVTDEKYTPGAQPSLGFLRVDEDGYRVQSVKIQGLAPTEMPNDLEAVCAVHGKPGNYLLVESGFKNGAFGRIFHVTLAFTGSDATATVASTFQPRSMLETWKDGSTPSAEQIEGAGCVSGPGDHVYLILGLRGSAKHPAVLQWGEIAGWETGRPSFIQQGEYSVKVNPLGDRAIGDLFLEPSGQDSWRLWTSATSDPGDDGPFRSKVYSPGIWAYEPGINGYTFQEESSLETWMFEGIKVEAIAEPASRLPSSRFSVGTDDEHYGGIWRPVPKNVSEVSISGTP